MRLNHEGGGPWPICDSRMLGSLILTWNMFSVSCFMSALCSSANHVLLALTLGSDLVKFLVAVFCCWYAMAFTRLHLYCRLHLLVCFGNCSDIFCPWLGPLLLSLPCNGFFRYTLSQYTVLCQGGLSPLQLSRLVFLPEHYSVLGSSFNWLTLERNLVNTLWLTFEKAT